MTEPSAVHKDGSENDGKIMGCGVCGAFEIPGSGFYDIK
jgi:hypothetical protein